MNIKMTNATMITLVNAINHFPLATGKIGYAMARTKSVCLKELASFDEVKEKIFQKYGKKDPEKGYVVDVNDKEELKKFNHEMEELLNITLDVDVYQIKQNEFEMPYSDVATLQDYEMIERILVNQTIE